MGSGIQWPNNAGATVSNGDPEHQWREEKFDLDVFILGLKSDIYFWCLNFLSWHLSWQILIITVRPDWLGEADK